MASTRPPLANSPKTSMLQVQNTSDIKSKEEMEMEQIATNEAIASAAKNPALQRALQVIRSAGTRGRKRKAMTEEGKSEVIAPRNMVIKNKGAISSIGILTSIPEDDVIIPPIKSLEIDQAWKLPEKSSKKEKPFDYAVIEI